MPGEVRTTENDVRRTIDCRSLEAGFRAFIHDLDAADSAAL
jgi:hypothetical protein